GRTGRTHRRVRRAAGQTIVRWILRLVLWLIRGLLLIGRLLGLLVRRLRLLLRSRRGGIEAGLPLVEGNLPGLVWISSRGRRLVTIAGWRHVRIAAGGSDVGRLFKPRRSGRIEAAVRI